VFKHSSQMNNHQSNHFKAPLSTSGGAGVNVYAGEGNGKVCVCSWHGEHDPIAKAADKIKPAKAIKGVIDAFQVYTELEHGGDGKAAMKAITTTQPSQPFKLSPINALLKQPPPFQWLIRDWLQPESEAMLIGESTAGKSFLAIDWALHIATGREWNGHKVKQAPVVYITGEGFWGLRLRVKAWEQEYGVLDNAPFALSEQAADFMSDTSMQTVADAIEVFAEDHGGKVGFVAVDTLHRNMVGDENSSNDFAIFTKNLKTLCQKYGATSLLIHHPGHSDKSRGRGSSAQKGSMDTQYLLSGERQGRVLKCDKMKDGAESPEPIGLSLKQIVLPWIDDEGDKLTSCVCEWGVPSKFRGKKMPNGVRLGLETLLSVDPKEGVTLESWRDVFYQRHHGDNIEAKKKAFLRAREKLLENKILVVVNDVYSVADGSIEPSWNDVDGLISAYRLSEFSSIEDEW